MLGLCTTVFIAHCLVTVCTVVLFYESIANLCMFRAGQEVQFIFSAVRAHSVSLLLGRFICVPLSLSLSLRPTDSRADVLLFIWPGRWWFKWVWCLSFTDTEMDTPTQIPRHTNTHTTCPCSAGDHYLQLAPLLITKASLTLATV